MPSANLRRKLFVVYGKRNPQMPVASDLIIPVLASVRIDEWASFTTMDAGIDPNPVEQLKSTCARG